MNYVLKKWRSRDIRINWNFGFLAKCFHFSFIIRPANYGLPVFNEKLNLLIPTWHVPVMQPTSCVKIMKIENFNQFQTVSCSIFVFSNYCWPISIIHRLKKIHFVKVFSQLSYAVSKINIFFFGAISRLKFSLELWLLFYMLGVLKHLCLAKCSESTMVSTVDTTKIT